MTSNETSYIVFVSYVLLTAHMKVLHMRLLTVQSRFKGVATFWA